MEIRAIVHGSKELPIFLLFAIRLSSFPRKELCHSIGRSSGTEIGLPVPKFAELS